MLHTNRPQKLRELLRNVAENHGPLAWTYESGGRRKAGCTCDEHRIHRSCRHTWIIALLQVTLNRLDLEPMPVLALDFDRDSGKLDYE